MSGPKAATGLLLVCLVFGLFAASSGCGSDATGSVSSESSTTPVASTTAAVLPTGNSVTATPIPAPSGTTVPPADPTPSATTEPSAEPVPDRDAAYELVAEMEFAYDAGNDPDQAGPQQVIDHYEAFFSQLAADESMVVCQFDVGVSQATFLFSGPNGPDIQDSGTVTTSAAYTWDVPSTLRAGTDVDLPATGISLVSVPPDDSSASSGTLYYSLFGSSERTMDIDFTGTGSGMILINPAFGNALPELLPSDPMSSGTYTLPIPEGPYVSLAIEVMYTPYDASRTLHRVYVYQLPEES